MDVMLERVLFLIGNKRGAIKPLAEFLGISGNNISDWKSGKNKSYRQYAPQIAEYYDVSLDWLSGMSDERTKEKPDAKIGIGLNERESKFLSIIKQLPPEKLELVEDMAIKLLNMQ